MARIRSIHPNQWTDEAFVELSFAARLLAIALRNEADDQGVFEWKPKALKMRLMPADNVDVAELLAELAEQNLVKSYEHEGRQYGAIRNFCRFQKPKKPNSHHPLPSEVRNYVCLKEAGVPNSHPLKGAAVPNQYGTGSEPVPQGEEKEAEAEKEKNAGARKGALSRSNGKQGPPGNGITPPHRKTVLRRDLDRIRQTNGGGGHA